MWWLSYGSWYSSATLWMEKTFKEFTFISLPCTICKFSSQSLRKVWRRFRLCPTVFKSRPKSFNPSKTRGNGSLGSDSPLRQVVPTLRKCSSFWSTVSGGCNQGPRHAQKPFSMDNIESLASVQATSLLESELGSQLRLILTAWWLVLGKAHALGTARCTVQSQASIVSFVQNHKRKMLTVLIHI